MNNPNFPESGKPNYGAVMLETDVNNEAMYGDYSVEAYCEKCRTKGSTKLKLRPNCCTYMFCICLLCIPFLIPGLNNLDHCCQHCGNVLGKVDRLTNMKNNCLNGNWIFICCSRCPCCLA